MKKDKNAFVSRRIINRHVTNRKFHIHIENFRKLQDINITLSPLTILTGENGSGKSTFFKALLFLSRNYDYEASRSLKYILNNEINLGDWSKIANQNNLPLTVEITEETFGTDSEFLEKFQYKNCPFAVFPTNERLKELENIERGRGNKYYQPLEIATLSTGSSKQQTSIKFTFHQNRLKWIDIADVANKLSCRMEYKLEPFSGWVNELITRHGAFYGEPAVIVFTNLMINGQAVSNRQLRIVSETFFNAETESELPFEFENYPSPAIGVLRFQNAPKFKESLPYYLYSAMSGSGFDMEEYSQILCYLNLLVSIYSNFTTQVIKKILSIGTTRQIPKSRYFEEDIDDSTYHGIPNQYSSITTAADFQRDSEQRLSSYLLQRFNGLLKTFKIAESLQIVNRTGVVSLELKQEGNSVNLAETSSGALQLLPILFSLNFNFHKSRLFLIQQPELHLHPRFQTKVVDFVLDILSPTPKYQFPEHIDITDNFQKLFNLGLLSILNDEEMIPEFVIIETHSEHIMRKVQLLIAQKRTLNSYREETNFQIDKDYANHPLKDNMSIYFFKLDLDGNVQSVKIELDDYGLYTSLPPKGFFDESLEINMQLIFSRN